MKSMQKGLVAAMAVAVLAAGRSTSQAADQLQPAGPGFASVFVDEQSFSRSGTSPYFVLQPGHMLVLEGTEDGQAVRDVQTVLPETGVLDGVTVGIVEDRETKGGKVTEVTRDYYAISTRTNGVYYFGEDVDEYQDGQAPRHGGSWRSGVKGARFGLLLPGVPQLGARFFEEIAPGVGMDRGEIIGVEETHTTPAGTFTHCVRVSETSALEPGSASDKVYAPGIGLIKDGSLQLTWSGFITKDQP